MIPKPDCFHDNQLRTMIQNAIKTQPALQVVQSQAQQFKVQNEKELSYPQYCALLESAAVAYDDSHKDKPCTNRKIYSHDLKFDIDYQASTNDELPATYDVNRASMTREQWNKLDTTAQTIWDSLPHEAKATILNRKPSNRTPHRPRYAANLHDMSTHDLLSSLSTGNSTGNTTETDTTSTGTNANDDNRDSKDSNHILTMLTQQRTSFTANQQDKKHPGDITRMMSTSNAKKPPSTVLIDGQLIPSKCIVLQTQPTQTERLHTRPLLYHPNNVAHSLTVVLTEASQETMYELSALIPTAPWMSRASTITESRIFVLSLLVRLWTQIEAPSY
jgi:hypothetical protein